MSEAKKRKPPGPRGRWLLQRLAGPDSPMYDELCHELVAAFPVTDVKPSRRRGLASVRGVRSVRGLLWNGLATTGKDERVYLTEAGWREHDRRAGQQEQLDLGAATA